MVGDCALCQRRIALIVTSESSCGFFVWFDDEGLLLASSMVRSVVGSAIAVIVGGLSDACALCGHVPLKRFEGSCSFALRYHVHKA